MSEQKEIVRRNFDFIESGGLSIRKLCSAYGLDYKYIVDTMASIRKELKKNGNKKVLKPVKKKKNYKRIPRKQFQKAIDSLKPKINDGDKILNFDLHTRDLTTREVHAKKVNELPGGKVQMIIESKMNYE